MSLNVKLPAATVEKKTCGSCGRPNDPKTVKYCSTCPAWLCQYCVTGHQTLPALKVHQLHDDDTSVGVTYTACEHHSYPLKYFCQTCSTVVCAECRLDGAHVDHVCVDIKIKVKENREKAPKDIEKLKKLKMDMETALNDSKVEFTDADKKLLDNRNTMHKVVDNFVDDKRKKNKQVLESFARTLQRTIDDVSRKLKTQTLVADEANRSLNMTELAMMSCDVTCRVPDKPTPDTDMTSLITSLTTAVSTCRVPDKPTSDTDMTSQMTPLSRAVPTPEYVQDLLSKNGLQAIRQLEQTVDGTWPQLCSTRPQLMEPVRQFLKHNPVQFKVDDDIHSLAGDRVSIVTQGWVNSYEAWVTQNQQSPGELVHHQTSPNGNLLYTDHRFLSQQQAEQLRLLFGCRRPLPLASNTDLLKYVEEYGRYYILLVKRIKKLNDVEGDVRVRLFNEAEQLPQGRLFYKGREVTKQCQGKQLFDIWNSLGLNQFDEISVLV